MGALFLAVWLSAVVFFAVKAREQRRSANMAWRLAAFELDLEIAPLDWSQQRQLRGRIDGLLVEVKEKRANKATFTVYTVRLPAPVPEGLQLSAESFATQLSARLGREDVRTGDERFDAAVSVRCREEAEVLARLVQPARRALRALVEKGVQLESGKLELELKTQVTEADELTEQVHALVRAARFFHLDGLSVPEALARNAAGDPEARVRLRNLSVLFRDHPRTEAAREAAAKALKDWEPAVRLRAAEFLPGATASPVLAALVRSGEETWVRAEALRVLSRKCDYAEISDTVALALRATEEELRQEAVRAVARGGDREMVDVLVEMADRPTLPLAETLVEAFGKIGGPRAEEALVQLLEHESDRVRALAAEALGEIGTVRAVEPLLPLTRGLLGGYVQHAARNAVRRIQGRLGQVEAGGLAVVDDQGGALSLPAPEGAVAVVPIASEGEPVVEGGGEGEPGVVRVGER